MRRATGVLLAVAAIAAAVAANAPGVAHGEASWRLEQPSPPEGARFRSPLGTPDDIEFYAPNEGLLSVEGNAVVPAGLYFWNGRSWHQLATVCGGAGEVSRIAWAGAHEFWVITEPSEPRAGSGLGLCHFKNGAIVGSYSTAFQAVDPFRPMDAAACNGPDDCWFAGIGSEDPSGQRVGAFHLHWDGSNLTSSYQPQGRGVSGLAYFGGTFYESTFVGAQPGNQGGPVSLSSPEPEGPVLIHRLAGGTFLDTSYRPYQYPGQPSEGVELLSAKSDGTDLWFSGGGAASGPAAPREGSVPAAPIAVRYDEPFFLQDPLDPSQFGSEDRFVDISPVPGTESAWVADQPYLQRASATAKAKVALIEPGGDARIETLPSSGPGRGSAQIIAATGPEEAWMATSAGWLFHYTNGAVLAEDTDPNWAGTITVRPNESVEQFVADTPPPDDSELFAPPPVQVETKPSTEPVQLVIPALLKNIKVSRRGLTVTISFQLTRLADVQLVAKLHGKVIARTPQQRMKAGRRKLVLTFQRKRWPDALSFKTKELTKPKPVPASGAEGEAKTGPTAVSTSVRRHG
ncbi:MAG TPA: hypothetical protein VFR48_11590 [Solirubrobacteraceae bacterium]|nr:hypothetical protein [Solirubrobacteraceae bacterium]